MFDISDQMMMITKEEEEKNLMDVYSGDILIKQRKSAITKKQVFM